jgi:DivIVA domain-containing protein
VDRERIERRDFPTGRRGYDPAAVDEHLRRLADEFEARSHAPAPSMADSTSEQVRLILEAAERGAAEMRSAAGSEASDHVARVQTAADGMLTKLDALESELTRLVTALRTSGERLAEGLAELQAEATLGHTVSPVDAAPIAAPDPADVPADDEVSRAAAPEPAVPPEQAQSADPEDADPQSDDAAAPDSPPLSAPGAPDWPAPADALFDAPPASDTLFAPADPDDDGARLIALNMALSGSSREATRLFLAEHFALPDIEGLLDDVYARAGR